MNVVGRNRESLRSLPFSSLFTRVEPINIVFLPRILQPASETFDDRFTFVGPSIRPRYSPPGFPLEKLGQQPVLYISLIEEATRKRPF
jgi:hypothetical protein